MNDFILFCLVILISWLFFIFHNRIVIRLNLRFAYWIMSGILSINIWCYIIYWIFIITFLVFKSFN
jgi:hypothetical protein